MTQRSVANTDGVQSFCLFVGWARSGSTLIGALLDAHENIVIANELDVLGQIESGEMDRELLFERIMKKSSRSAGRGENKGGYQYDVTGASQGTCEEVLVIGDKKAGMTNKRISENPMLLEKLRRVVEVPLKVIIVLRNPFDILTTQSMRRGRRIGCSPYIVLPKQISVFEALAENISNLMEQLEPNEKMLIKHEEIIEDPRGCLRELCDYLKVPASDEYIGQCAEIVYSSPHKSRNKIQWDNATRMVVQDIIGRHAFLAGYDFDN